MNCSKCKAELKEDLSLNKNLFGYYKVYTFFCLGCDYERVKKIKIGKEDYLSLLNERILKAQNTTQKTYSQNYNKLGGLVA